MPLQIRRLSFRMALMRHRPCFGGMTPAFNRGGIVAGRAAGFPAHLSRVLAGVFKHEKGEG